MRKAFLQKLRKKGKLQNGKGGFNPDASLKDAKLREKKLRLRRTLGFRGKGSRSGESGLIGDEEWGGASTASSYLRKTLGSKSRS